MSLEEGCLSRVYQTSDGILRIVDAQTVDDQIDLTGLLGERGIEYIVDPHDLSSLRRAGGDPDTGIAFQLIGLQLLFQCASLRQMDGRHHQETCTLRVFEYLLDHVLGRVLLHLRTTDGAIRAPYARVKQSEILVYLR